MAEIPEQALHRTDDGIPEVQVIRDGYVRDLAVVTLARITSYNVCYTKLLRAWTLPVLEGLVGRDVRRRWVALQQRHLAAAVAEVEGQGQAGHAAAHDCDSLEFHST